ncbi:TetR/AcrR family transcriptional regulator [Nocardia tengchongensis]|uniref:TetR/AcrR family transcriptional regulator n=1 Tax=Nocardia tengchongensis TaxID=2055889 RepID=UPI003685686B
MPYRNLPSEIPQRHPGGRPRDEQLEQRILAAVAAVLSESGYEGVSFEEVARRCGASKSSLYRRWKSKRDMVVTALRAGPARRHDSDEIDTGSLRGDLLALCERLNQTMRSADGRTAWLLMQAGLEDPELCEAIETSMGPTGARLPRSVIDAAIARGELPADTSPFPYEEIVGATLLIRRLNGLLVDAHYLDALIDTVLVPSLRATSDRSQSLPTGIFSGNPATQTNPAQVEDIP